MLGSGATHINREVIRLDFQLELLYRAAWAVAVFAVWRMCRNSLGWTPWRLAVCTSGGMMLWVSSPASERVPKQIFLNITIFRSVCSA